MTGLFRKSGGQAFGLEIGTSAIKAVMLGPGGSALQHAVMAPTPLGSMRDGSVVEPQAIANEIRSLLGGSGIQTRQVVTAIPNQATVTRNILIPKMTLKELRESDVIRYEAERYIPYPIDEVTLDFHVLDNPDILPEDAQMEVVVAAVPNDVVNRHVETLQMAGLQPTVVDVKGFAAMRTIGLRGLGADEVVLTLEIGASSSVIGLMRGERLLMSRNINVAADDFTTALQKAFDLEFGAAEALKLSYQMPGSGLADPAQSHSPARVSEALRPTMIDLITEVRRSLEFYRVQSGELMIDQLVMAGGGAKLSGLDSAMSEALGIPTEMVQPWQFVDMPMGNDPALSEYAPEYTVPLGLALRGAGRG
ncbi:type IV pilus assembly protein PilM [Deinococcus radiophilus]|uniref:Type IV pilus assembly protein PilM n=1 Tax=Deinococcus radiophilus TaxID=32062 RepID=A0A3S0K9R6_9DEIO|nr:type IV pilus assembly protein PilM [Deinococcus radiophilus]RTR25822.1 type IV pilus assembly protein PilM [Deinococcus radiophilus]UFA50868.1 type IV pilus assembly protein PilM [Deinococcus radiophilus]